jgi:hypothetical protein
MLSREQRRQYFLKLLKQYTISHEEAADLLHLSVSAIDAWCKPATSKSSNPTPAWALELLRFKIAENAMRLVS